MAFLDGVVTRAEREHFKVVLAELRKHYPDTFNPRKPLPLCEEASHDILNNKLTCFTFEQIDSFLETWKNRYEYICAMCLHGKFYTLEGEVTSIIGHEKCLDLMQRMAKLYIGAHRMNKDTRIRYDQPNPDRVQ